MKLPSVFVRISGHASKRMCLKGTFCLGPLACEGIPLHGLGYDHLSVQLSGHHHSVGFSCTKKIRKEAMQYITPGRSRES